jgi:hypothetical protein
MRRVPGGWRLRKADAMRWPSTIASTWRGRRQCRGDFSTIYEKIAKVLSTAILIEMSGNNCGNCFRKLASSERCAILLQ